MKVIVLTNSKYKENDIIFNAISEEGECSFKVCGGQSSKSPYVWLNNPLTIAEVEFGGDRRFKYPTLKEAKLISSSLTLDNDLNYLCTIAVINELVNKCFAEGERHILFKDIEESLTALKNNKDKLMVILILLARVAKYTGSELEVDKCVFCGSTKDIIAFSFPDGGFVCKNCFENSMATTDLTPNQMLLIRYIFKSPNYECRGSDRYTDEDKKVILKCLREYLFDDIGVRLESITALL